MLQAITVPVSLSGGDRCINISAGDISWRYKLVDIGRII